ncbi:hypothetical protein HYR99_04430, partial [Candidatus Poribacteria bacterium]|nr:hypothetical protein [Candidatus Poribacteria bacterium]
MASPFLSGIPPSISAAFAASGDWPMWRGDGRLTGYQPLPGAMKTPLRSESLRPEALARYFLGAGTGAVTPADLSGTGMASELLIVARARLYAYDAQGQPLWEYNPSIPPVHGGEQWGGYWLQQVAYVADLDGDGQVEVVALAGHLGGTRWAFLILDGQRGHLRA